MNKDTVFSMIAGSVYIVLTVLALSTIFFLHINYAHQENIIRYIEDFNKEMSFDYQPTLITISEHEIMIQEVVMFWNIYYDEKGIRKNHPRRKNFPIYAKHVVEIVKKYQTEETDFGVKLPQGRDVHLIIASMITYESQVNHKLEGALGEVGLMQVNRCARKGISKRKIKNNPRLGIDLGVRWLAYHTQFCGINKEEWTIKDWLGPMTLYGTGINKGINNKGVCKQIQFSRRRINRALTYKKKINKNRFSK